MDADAALVDCPVLYSAARESIEQIDHRMVVLDHGVGSAQSRNYLQQ